VQQGNHLAVQLYPVLSHPLAKPKQ
jgi:hypothetical protein